MVTAMSLTRRAFCGSLAIGGLLAAAPAGAEAPVQVTDMTGRTVNLPTLPKRIILLEARDIVSMALLHHRSGIGCRRLGGNRPHRQRTFAGTVREGAQNPGRRQVVARYRLHRGIGRLVTGPGGRDLLHDPVGQQRSVAEDTGESRSSGHFQRHIEQFPGQQGRRQRSDSRHAQSDAHVGRGAWRSRKGACLHRILRQPP